MQQFYGGTKKCCFLFSQDNDLLMFEFFRLLEWILNSFNLTFSLQSIQSAWLVQQTWYLIQVCHHCETQRSPTKIEIGWWFLVNACLFFRAAPTKQIKAQDWANFARKRPETVVPKEVLKARQLRLEGKELQESDRQLGYKIAKQVEAKRS